MARLAHQRWGTCMQGYVKAIAVLIGLLGVWLLPLMDRVIPALR